MCTLTTSESYGQRMKKFRITTFNMNLYEEDMQGSSNLVKLSFSQPWQQKYPYILSYKNARALQNDHTRTIYISIIINQGEIKNNDNTYLYYYKE